MEIVKGFQDTRTNKEDFAITPYLFSVLFSGKNIKVRGIGICWGFWSYYIGIKEEVDKIYVTSQGAFGMTSEDIFSDKKQKL